MLKRVFRALAPVLLFLAGVVAVGYGFYGHEITVVEKPKIETADAGAKSEDAAPGEEAAPDEAAGEEAEDPFGGPDEGPPPDPWMGPPGGDPWMSGPRDPWMEGPPGPGMGPPPHEEQAEEEKPQQEEPKERILEEPEPTIVRDVTVGGVERSAAGELVRTYSAAAGEKPPQKCPT